ncbi:MAG: hypothetical protein EAX95_10920 [Candidatus Thorarchaeota archaeon]|nr:hypothetical protein [Candidatus Thorarchaeota archaeon]
MPSEKRNPEEICPNCGHDASDDNTFFDCEWCRRAICSFCHRMTSDYDLICPQCVKEKGLTEDDLEN